MIVVGAVDPRVPEGPRLHLDLHVAGNDAVDLRRLYVAAYITCITAWLFDRSFAVWYGVDHLVILWLAEGLLVG